mgnify:CR=1 FL=1
MGEFKEEKELSDDVKDSFNSYDVESEIEPDTRTSRNDNKKDESVRWSAILIQMLAEVCLEIDRNLLSTKHARFDNFAVRAL